MRPNEQEGAFWLWTHNRWKRAYEEFVIRQTRIVETNKYLFFCGNLVSVGISVCFSFLNK